VAELEVNVPPFVVVSFVETSLFSGSAVPVGESEQSIEYRQSCTELNFCVLSDGTFCSVGHASFWVIFFSDIVLQVGAQ